ncbi:hypothetical protein [Carboxydothermus pertinax]|uniref:ATPase AAA-type core domain-containing protein n=1 Tax=Carboxydothermus pertinax TaxID=870242 RepID=A0A1L8CVS9_9THEO|nr:hypothetical protein [Carboxydothermus pertinax]GAV23001.1 hypothetical protein cpu_15110 [Carboxydothermus pertinax]
MEYLQVYSSQQEFFAIKLMPKVNVFCGPYYLGLKRAFEKVKEDEETVAVTYDELYTINPETYLNDFLEKEFWREKNEFRNILELLSDLNQKILRKDLELKELKETLLKLPAVANHELDTEKLKLLKEHLKEQEKQEIFKIRIQKEFERFFWQLERFSVTLAEFSQEGFWSEEKVLDIGEKLRQLKDELMQLITFKEEKLEDDLLKWLEEQENLLETYLQREKLLTERTLGYLELKELLRHKVKLKRTLSKKQKEYLEFLLNKLKDNIPEELNFFTYQILIDGDNREYCLYLEKLFKSATPSLKKKLWPLCDQISPKRLIRLLNHPEMEKQPEFESFADLLYWLRGRLTLQDRVFLKSLVLGERVKLILKDSKEELSMSEPELQNLVTLILYLLFETKTLAIYYPERAMDSYKITRWLIPVLKERRKQTLIFTQNPALITALKPENLVVFGFSEKKPSFVQKNANDPEVKKLLLTFLEGGPESFAGRQNYYQV